LILGRRSLLSEQETGPVPRRLANHLEGLGRATEDGPGEGGLSPATSSSNTGSRSSPTWSTQGPCRSVYRFVVRISCSSASRGSLPYFRQCGSDDHDMHHGVLGATTIFRTPRISFQLFKAFSWTPPDYGHGLSSRSQRAKLSKAEIEHFAAIGLPVTRVGIPALLGGVIMPEAIGEFPRPAGLVARQRSRSQDARQMVKLFNVERLGSDAGPLLVAKLQWMNCQYIRKVPLGPPCRALHAVSPVFGNYLFPISARRRLRNPCAKAAGAAQAPWMGIASLTSSCSFRRRI